jgi:hypothetical protein
MVIYVCHPYSDSPEINRLKVIPVCRALVNAGHVPVCVHLLMHHYMDEVTERGKIMDQCLMLISRCDEVWVFSKEISLGMEEEIKFANDIGIPVVQVA